MEQIKETMTLTESGFVRKRKESLKMILLYVKSGAHWLLLCVSAGNGQEYSVRHLEPEAKAP